MKKQIFSCLLTLCLLATLTVIAPITASADFYGDYTFTVSGGKATITDFATSASGAITIPSTLRGFPVTAIDSAAFAGCENLTSITIPDSVVFIDYSAFSSCKSLTSITLPGSINWIADDMFIGCSSLTSITIPDSVTVIGFNAFAYCRSLTSIVIPDSVDTICMRAFDGCVNLTNISLPDNTMDIDADAFVNSGYYNASNNWENDGLYIGNHLIAVKDSIGDAYEIKKGTIDIARDTFFYRTNLTSIIIPDSITSFGINAFAGCDNLTDVYYTGTEEEWNEISMEWGNEVLANATIHYNWVNYDAIENITVADVTVAGVVTFAAKVKANHLDKDYGIIVDERKFYGAKPGDTVGDYNGSTKFTFDGWTGEFAIVLTGVTIGEKAYQYFVGDELTKEEIVTVVAE